jgi:hypothetical protein
MAHTAIPRFVVMGVGVQIFLGASGPLSPGLFSNRVTASASRRRGLGWPLMLGGRVRMISFIRPSRPRPC